MDHRPLITYAGDMSVFQAIAPSLQKEMGGEAVDWRRAYGRPTKHVHLHPRFIPFEPTSSTGQEEVTGSNAVLNTLLDQSMLHTFWTDCSDVEVYRTTTKDMIQSWLNDVKSCNIRDWLVVLVEAPENKKAKQLLPRTSVLDKIKSDFAQKQVERCIALSDPTKLDSKSAESLNAVLHRLRSLILTSYSKTLTKFEENMRAQREKRNEPGWNFCHYFLLQEELAFVLEMMEIYEEALVQYDELDALFTQFVLNSHLTDTPQWLLSFQRSGDQWPALSLSTSASSTALLQEVRQKIRNSTVSLLPFRNYLFARQASLLVKQKRINELAQRSLSFLHNAINELSILDVTFTEVGATSAWVLVSALEILGTICGHGQASAVHTAGTVVGSGDHSANVAMSSADFSVHTASLWDYAREKLYELGKLCELLPQSQPKSDHLHKVISLAAGLGTVEPDAPKSAILGKNSAGHRLTPEEFLSIQILVTPIEKLKNALSSKDQFQTHYLELCELAMGTYKHIGRIRSARKVGLSLALYYMEGDEHQKAVGFLTDALKTFRDEKWNVLVVEILLKLATCYKATGDTDKYLKTTAQLAASNQVKPEDRNYFFKEFTTTLDSIPPEDGVTLSSTEDCLAIRNVRVETLGKLCGDACEVVVFLEVESHFPQVLPSAELAMAIVTSDPHHSMPPGSTELAGGKVTRRLSGGKKVDRKESLVPLTTCEDEDILWTQEDTNPGHLRLELGQSFDTKQDKSIQGGKITCHNSHLALRWRKESNAKTDFQLMKTDFSVCAKQSCVSLEPGINKIKLEAKMACSGSFRLGQLSVGVGSFEFVSPRLGCRYTFSIDKVAGTITLGEERLSLIAGIEQFITIHLDTGSNHIKHGMHLNVRGSSGLQLKPYENAPLTSEFSIPLAPTKPFCGTEVRMKVKADLGPQKDNSVIEHKLMVKCPWSSEEVKLSLTFQPPFMSSFKVHTSIGGRKFIQVLLQGLADRNFTLSNHQLQVQGQQATDIPLVPLNPRSQELCLTHGQTASYMFEMGVTELVDADPMRLEFSMTFAPANKSQPPALYKYYFSLQNFKTQYELKYRVDPQKGLEFCRAGTMCCLVVEILKVNLELEEAETSLMYEVRADQHLWAICGRTSGVVSMSDGLEVAHVTVDVLPMSPGFLPLPTVYLSKYIPADIKGGSSTVKLDPFHSGQVFNWCKGTQVHVLPPSQGSTTSGSAATSALNSLNETHF